MRKKEGGRWKQEQSDKKGQTSEDRWTKEGKKTDISTQIVLECKVKCGVGQQELRQARLDVTNPEAL